MKFKIILIINCIRYSKCTKDQFMFVRKLGITGYDSLKYIYGLMKLSLDISEWVKQNNASI